MDKNAIKKYAVWAREELIERVSQKVDQYEISADADPNADSAHGVLLTPSEKKQRVSLITRVKDKGMDQVIEEVAYTWFNRFAALRFMEVNNYLPSRVRVFTDEEGAFKPEILTEAIHLELKGLDMEKVYALKEANDDEALFKYLIIAQCNALSSVLPGMFQKIADYTELLFPDNLLREGSVIEQMVTTIFEADWKDQVQIIGWLYQYYNTEPKDRVFADLKKNKKITKEKIPAATQLFTPDWIVRYMVENSLGRLWVEGHPNDDLKASWKYYLDEAEQEPEVQKQLDDIKKEYAALTPEEIRCIDPCMGSGHIICYMFDVLMQIYEAYGYTTRDAVSSIVKNNLYGLDIDDRASQIAYFSVMMKACQYDRRFLSRGIQPHVYAIMESNGFDTNMIDTFTGGRKELKTAISSLVSDLHDAKEYGSILDVKPVDFTALYARFDEIRNENPNMYTYQILDELLPFVQVAEMMAQKYHVVVTNPPYMGSSGMSGKLSEFVKRNYPDSKSDLFAVFIERCGQMTLKNCFQAMITQHAWMFLSSFEKLRKKLLQKTMVNMAHLGARAFEEIGGEVVQTTSFVLLNDSVEDYKGVYFRLIEPTTQQSKEDMFLIGDNRYESSSTNFKIPGSPVAYWVSPALIHIFDRKLNIGMISDFTGSQNITADNNTYLRMFWEVDAGNVGRGKKWVYYAKGGEFRKWYGDIQLIIDVSTSAVHYYKTCPTANYLKERYWFQEGITYSAITSSGTGFRYFPAVGGFDKGGATLCYVQHLYYVLGILNSNLADTIFQVMNPTINLQVKDVKSLPVIIDQSQCNDIEGIVKENVSISKQDWDSFETSYDFAKSPLIIEGVPKIEDAFNIWDNACTKRFEKIKCNEELLNKRINAIYGISDKDVSTSVLEKNVTVRKANKSRDIKNFISYAVGCMFGRYSLDKNGIVCSSNSYDEKNYTTYPIDGDNIIPICDDEYFNDDIVGRFIDFVSIVYGKEYLEDNLKFIAEAIGGRGDPIKVIRNYFINDFFSDHCANYAVTGMGKRPIYWLFDSGKKNGFKCLIYMHRYQPDTIARIRTDYVHEQQARYRTAISGLERQINGASTSERVRLNKQLEKLKDQAEETRLYEEKIHHLADQMISIDLDDGVKHNYAIFQDVLAKIK